MDIDSEVQDIRRPLSELETEVSGEKSVTRKIFEWTQENRQRLDRVEAEIVALRADMPGIVAQAVGNTLAASIPDLAKAVAAELHKADQQ